MKKLLLIIALAINLGKISTIQASAAGTHGKENTEEGTSSNDKILTQLKSLYLQSNLSIEDKEALMQEIDVKIAEFSLKLALLKTPKEGANWSDNLSAADQKIKDYAAKNYTLDSRIYTAEGGSCRKQIAEITSKIPKNDALEILQYLLLLETFGSFIKRIH